MIPLQQYLFIDIETVSGQPRFEDLSPAMQQLWLQKCNAIKTTPDADPARLYEQRAGIFSEFAKVICIGLGCIVKKEDGWKIFMKMISGDDEKQVLASFAEAINLFVEREKDVVFCGHNIKEFDIPFLCRRMVVHDIKLPSSIDISGKKPWEVKHEDTMELWRFGDKKNYTSLALLAEVLNIPAPKEDMDGTQVNGVYWSEKSMERIVDYCRGDVITAARVFLRLKNIKGISLEPVHLP